MLGSALMLASFIEDIKQDLKSLNQSLKTNRNPAEFQKRFKTIIQFHSDVKELSIHIMSSSFFQKKVENTDDGSC